MARRLIGLDVGTNAVSIAEIAAGDPVTLKAFGQIALPAGAMREGEVVDESAVSDAIARLRSEIGIRRAKVRVGIASPRLIVRQVEMPEMSESELRSALEFQAQDLIPIPMEEAVLDFSVLGRSENEDGETMMRILLAAAQEATVMRLVEAVESGGFGVESVDLIPLALVRSLGRTVASDNGPGAEAIVSFGGGVTVVTVHEAGVPAFVRVLGTGGRELTDAIISELDLPDESAESLKRQIGSSDASDDALAQARAAIDRPLGVLLDEVRSSLDYYRNQPGATRLMRVVITGGGSQLPGLADRLTTLIGVPVELASPRDNLAVGDIGFDDSDLPRLDPYLPAPVGLALGGIRNGAVIDLLARPSRVGGGRGRVVAAGVIAAALLVGALAIPTISRQSNIDDKEDELAAAKRTNADLQLQIDELSDAQEKQQALETARAQLGVLLASDVSWSRMLQEVARTIPNDVWLKTFDGQVAAPATATAAVPGSAIGTVGISASGLEFPSVSSWIVRMSEIPSFEDLWVSSAAVADFSGREVVDFTSDASITEVATSNRADALADLPGGPDAGDVGTAQSTEADEEASQ